MQVEIENVLHADYKYSSLIWFYVYSLTIWLFITIFIIVNTMLISCLFGKNYHWNSSPFLSSVEPCWCHVYIRNHLNSSPFLSSLEPCGCHLYVEMYPWRRANNFCSCIFWCMHNTIFERIFTFNLNHFKIFGRYLRQKLEKYNGEECSSSPKYGGI